MAARRTVLHLIDTGGPGGAETILLNVVNGLDRERWRSIAVVPVRDWLWGALEECGIEPVLLTSAGSFDFGYLRRLRQMIGRYGADIVHTHLFGSAVYASLAAAFTNVPVVCTFHGPTDIGEREGHRRAKLRIIGRRPNRYTFVSTRLRDWFLRVHGIDAWRARVVHNGIDCEAFRPARDDAMRAILRAHPGDVLIGAVGNMRRPKDYPTFLRAAAILARQSDRYRFVLVGAADEPILGELTQLRDELGLRDRVHFAGFRADIERVMNALDVYVLTSSTEGFSLTTVQAMASGVPVVATRCGGPEEIVLPDQTGVLVPVGDAEAIANAVVTLSAGGKRRELYVEAARQRAVEHFSLHSMVNGYTHIYDECLGGRNSARSESRQPALAAG